MPQSYCSAGHLVKYAGVKPTKCPTCQVSLETPSVAAIAAALPMASASITPPSAPRQPWPQQNGAPRRPATFHVQQADFGDDDFTFEGDLSISRDEDAPMTVEQLAKSDEPIERRSESRRAPEGKNEVVTASALVDEMVRTNGGQSTPTPAPKRARAPRKAAAKAPRATKRTS